MKKIFIVCRYFKPNSGSYAGMIEEFSKRACKKYKIKILSLNTNQKQQYKETKEYAEIIRFKGPKFKLPFFGINTDYLVLAREVRSYFRKNPPREKDRIIANSRAALGVLNHKYFLRMGQPAFTFLNNMELAKNEVSIFSRMGRAIHHLIMYFMEKKVVKNAFGFIISSEKNRRNILNYYGGDKKPYFIPFSGVKYKGLQKGEKNHKRGRKLLFVSAGKEKIRKGVNYIEAGLPTLFEKYKDLKLIHVGEKFSWSVPPKYNERILSVGKIPWERMKDYYATADMFVLASLQEGFPNTILEAMAAGCPIVTSDIDGIEEYITHKKEGYIFERANTKSLIEGIEYMLQNPKKARVYSDCAKKKARRLDYKHFSGKLVDFLENKNTKTNLLKTT